MAESGNGREREPQSLAEAVLETTVDGIISIDERGVVLSFNRAAAAMFAYTRDEVIGQNVSILMGEPEHSEHDSYLSRYESTGEARIIGIGREVEGRRKDGSTFPLDLAVSEAVDSNGSRIYVGILRDLTEHREARRAIRASESQYESLVRSAPIGIAISDEGRWIFEANDALCDMLGVPMSEIIGKRLSQFERNRPERPAGGGFRALLSGELERSDIEREFLRPDGSLVYAHTTTVAVRDENGDFAYAFRLVQDVTEEREARTKLAEAEEQYAVVVENMSDGVSVIEDGRRVFVNAPFVSIFGYRDEDHALSSAPFSSLVADDREKQMQREAEGKGASTVVRHRRQGGAIALIEQKLTSIVYQGRPAVLTVNRDVTAEVESRAALVASEERFRSLFDSAPIGIALLDANRKMTVVNQTLREMLGRTHDEMRGTDAQEFTNPGQERLNEGLYRSLVDGSVRFMVRDREMVRADGSTIWSHQTTSRVEDEQGRFAFAIRTVTDISDLKRTEDALRSSQNDLMQLSMQSESIIRAAADGILALDVAGNIISINPVASRMLGVPAAEAVGQRARDLTTLVRADGTRHPEGLNVVSLVLADGQERETVNERIEYTDGTWIDLERVVSPLFAGDGVQVIGAVMIARDVTERKRVERSKSEFLAMTSHELRTPLTAIHAAVGLSGSGVLGELPNSVKQQLDIASANSNRLVALVNDIVTLEQFGLGEVRLDLRLVEMHEVLREAVNLVTPLATTGEVDIAMTAPQITAECDVPRVQQVLTNLLGNALKYAPAGTRVTVAAEASEREVTISVSDEGPGIDPNQAPRIFEQFQQAEPSSTRPHQGSGLGLAIAKAIVEQHYGRIWVDSVRGAGSTFRFTLPLRQAH